MDAETGEEFFLFIWNYLLIFSRLHMPSLRKDDDIPKLCTILHNTVISLCKIIQREFFHHGPHIYSSGVFDTLFHVR
jgi:hypothetical protein